MYSRQHRTAKTSSNDSDTPTTNQFAPRPFVLQPQTEEVKPQQNATPDLQTKAEEIKEVGSGFPDSAIFTRHLTPPKIPRIQMKLSIGKSEQQADRVAADVVQRVSMPKNENVQYQELPKEEELQIKSPSGTIQRQDLPEEEPELNQQENYMKDIEGGKFQFLTNTGKDAAKVELASDKAKKVSKDHNLSDAELAAIRIYTAQDYAYINPILAGNKGWLDFKVANLTKTNQWSFDKEKLSDDEYKQIKDEGMRHSKMTTSGLKKLPDIEKETYRGLGLSQADFEAQYQEGKIVTFAPFTSTSLDRDVSEGFAQSEAVGGKVGILLIMDVKKGKDIDQLSYFEGEKEILLPPGAKFRVEKIIPKGKIYEIYVTQVN